MIFNFKQHSILLLMLGWFITNTSYSKVEKKVVQLRLGDINLVTPDVPLSLLTESIERNIPLFAELKTEVNDQGKAETKPPKPTPPKDFHEQIVLLKKMSADLIGQGKQNSVLALELLEQQNSKVTPEVATSLLPNVVKVSEVKRVPVDVLDKSTVSQLMKCARVAIPILKMALRPSEENYKTLTLLSILDGERGNGAYVQSNGIPCGKYLGHLGLADLNLSEQAKVLSAIVSNYPVTPSETFWTVMHLYEKSKKLPNSMLQTTFFSSSWKHVLSSQILYAVVWHGPRQWVESFIKDTMELNSSMPSFKISFNPDAFEKNILKEFDAAFLQVSKLGISNVHVE